MKYVSNSDNFHSNITQTDKKIPIKTNEWYIIYFVIFVRPLKYYQMIKNGQFMIKWELLS